MNAAHPCLSRNIAAAGWELVEEVIDDFEQQMKEAVNEEHEGKRKNETTWKIHRIHWEKNRFIYDLMYVRKVMSRELVSVNRACSRLGRHLSGSPCCAWRRSGHMYTQSLSHTQTHNTHAFPFPQQTTAHAPPPPPPYLC